MIKLFLDADYSGKMVVELYVGMGEVEASHCRLVGQTVPPPCRLAALVDTGAGRTVVEEKWLRDLGLSPLGETAVHTASTGTAPVLRNVYAVELSLAGDATGT